MVKVNGAFKYKQGVIGFPREVIRSDAFLKLKPAAKALMMILQDVWRPHEPNVHFSVRRAGDRLNVSKNSAAVAFKELLQAGFIVCAEESDWLNGKARVWRLTWVPIKGKEPTNEWNA